MVLGPPPSLCAARPPAWCGIDRVGAPSLARDPRKQPLYPARAHVHSQGAGMAEEGEYVADFEAVDDSVLLAAIKQRGAKVEPLCK